MPAAIKSKQINPEVRKNWTQGITHVRWNNVNIYLLCLISIGYIILYMFNVNINIFWIDIGRILDFKLEQ